MRALRFRCGAHEVGREAVDLVTVFVAQLDSHRVDAVDAEARASGFVALAQRHRDDDVAALVAGEVTDRTRDRGERRAELAVERRLEERARPESLVDDDRDLAPRRCLLVEMDRGLEPSVRRDPQVLARRDAGEPCPSRRSGAARGAGRACRDPARRQRPRPRRERTSGRITRARRRSEGGHSAGGAAPPTRSGRG